MKKVILGVVLTLFAVVAAATMTIGGLGSVACDAYPSESSVACDVYGETSSQQLRVIVNGSELINASPEIINGNTMVPVRAIFEALGARVDWDSNTKTAYGYSADGSIIVEITIDSNIAYVNGKVKALAQSAVISGGRTLVPARFISEALGADVVWNANTKTVVISK